jgi:hypothetical protein
MATRFMAKMGTNAPEDADQLTAYINEIEDIFHIELADENSELITIIGDNIDKKYLNNVKSVTINQAIIDEFGKNLNIVFTHFMVQVKCLVVKHWRKQVLKKLQLLKNKLFLMVTSQLLNRQTLKAKLLLNFQKNWVVK